MKTEVLVALVFLLSACSSAPRNGPVTAPAPAAGGPSLVVVLVVDQMRTDYLERGMPHFTAGLKRLTTEGAWFKNAAYPFMNTITCAGHATIGTGALPFRHGMVLNAWWDRGTARSVGCTADAAVRNIGYTGTPAGGESAATLLVPTLADRIGQGGGRTVGMSLKPRSAITLTGSHPTSVVCSMTAQDGPPLRRSRRLRRRGWRPSSRHSRSPRISARSGTAWVRRARMQAMTRALENARRRDGRHVFLTP